MPINNVELLRLVFTRFSAKHCPISPLLRQQIGWIGRKLSHVYGQSWPEQHPAPLDILAFYVCFRGELNQVIFAVNVGRFSGARPGPGFEKEFELLLDAFRSVLIEQYQNQVPNLDSWLPHAELIQSSARFKEQRSLAAIA